MAKIILVAGAAGFLGSNLCRKLISDGNSVIGVDDFCTGDPENLKDLMSRKTFKLIQADINRQVEIKEPIDQIYNLACPASPPLYQKMPLHTLKTCSQGVFNLLNLTQKKGAHFLQASTSEVYGDPEVSPQSENYRGNVSPVGPRSCYDEGKRFAESLVTNFSGQQTVDARIVRIFNTYGPGMRVDDGRVVSNFVVQALKGLPLTVYGSGNQTRSFCFVDDMVSGLIAAMNSKSATSKPINLGNEKSITINQLAETILKLTGSSSEIEFNSLPADDPRKRCPNTDFAKELLGWQATTSLSKGLKATIEFFAAKLKRHRPSPEDIL